MFPARDPILPSFAPISPTPRLLLHVRASVSPPHNPQHPDQQAPAPPPFTHTPNLRRLARAKLRLAARTAEDAWRSLRLRQHHLPNHPSLPLGLATPINAFAGGGGIGRPPRRPRNNHHHHNDNNNDDENNDDDLSVDPTSWGVAPGVHVIMRRQSDQAYRVAVAHLLALANNTLPNNPPTTAAFLPGAGAHAPADPTVPLVILLSWMGASPRSLTKYKSFYESIGYEVHVVLNGLKTAMFPPASRKQAEHVAQIIHAQPSDRPVFVHAFSIGTGIYGLLLDAIRHDLNVLESVKNKVVGVVFDSGPAPIFPKDVAKGLHTVCPMISKTIWESAANAFFFITQARKSFERSEKALANLQFPSPQLYFYCKDDKVISNIQQAVDNFVETNKQRGIEVYKMFWEKSVHATHLKIHPEEYIANLEKFVQRCMEVRSSKVVSGIGAVHR